jgi:hypothetical protein
MMKKMALLVSLFMIVSTFTAAAWGPMDPTDEKADPDDDKLGNLDEFKAGTNPLNPDSDNGGCWDGWEVIYGLDPTNPADDGFDTDNDGWTNLREFLEGTNPLNPNTDGDQYPLDSTDPNPLVPDTRGDPRIGPVPVPNPVHELDSDNDSLPDVFEPEWGTDPFNWDSDGDKLNDGLEFHFGSDPNDPDTDDDGLWDGQEVWKVEGDKHFTGTSPTRADSDGNGIDDYHDDTDMDHLPNWAEWKYDPLTGEPLNYTNPRNPDTDGDRVRDGIEITGNPANGDQTSDPLLADTDDDQLTDDIDPRTWLADHLAMSRVVGNSTCPTPFFPGVVTKGVPFNVQGQVEFNMTTYTGEYTGDWTPISVPMLVQIWIEQDGEMVPISDPVVTGNEGLFKVSVTLGDNVRAGQARLVITTSIHETVEYLPMVWDDASGNRLP